MMEVRGIVLPSPTVFLEDGRVDDKLMEELTDWYLAWDRVDVMLTPSAKLRKDSGKHLL